MPPPPQMVGIEESILVSGEKKRLEFENNIEYGNVAKQ